MKGRLARISAMLFLCCLGASFSAPVKTQSSKSTSSGAPGFPQAVRVGLWYLHPPRELRIQAEAGKARFSTCANCKTADLTKLTVRANNSLIRIDGVKSAFSEIRLTGSYELIATGQSPVRADFPAEIKAGDGGLQVTAVLPMDEYIAGVLAGEVGQFKSEEALKAMAVAARTYAMHFGSRHALEGFNFCDSTHCQNLHASGIDPRLRRIAESTSGEVLWYDGEPAAAYYHANCGGKTEDGRFIMGNDEPRAPFLRQHSDQYCLRSGGSQWRSEVSKHDLQQALQADGVTVPGTLRSMTVAERTPSGRVEFLRVTGSGPVTVAAPTLRFAVGRHLGWDRLRSNWYDVSDAGDRIVFHGRGSGHGVGLCQVGADVMGEEGHSYREILAFYYPGTQLGVAALGNAWQQLASEDIVLLTTQPERDRSLLPLATKLLHDSEESTGLIFRAAPRLKVYPTVAAFRNTTGEPGWVAASTRGRTIQMQPPDVLRSAGTLQSTLQHELLHMLIESYAKPGIPLWFREGLVLYLTERNGAARAPTLDPAALEKTLRAPASEEQLRLAYTDAGARVSMLAQQHGRAQLLDWVLNGLPAQL